MTENIFTLTNEKETSLKTIEALNKKGAVVLLPTETVYGLLCRADDLEAVERIYKLKHRSESKLLAWFVADWKILDDFGVELTPLAKKLAQKYTPGAITIVTKKKNSNETIAFRIPDHKFVLKILEEIKVPLAATSANRSGQGNALSLDMALNMLNGEVDVAVDGGDIPESRLASTVVDATGEKIKILRQGELVIDESFLK